MPLRWRGLPARSGVLEKDASVFGVPRIYVAIHWRGVESGIEFDWDDDNVRHLAAHRVEPFEFEQVLHGDPVDLAYDVIDEEARYRSVGLTDSGRLLSIVWTIRDGKVRAITAFPSGALDKKAYFERLK